MDRYQFVDEILNILEVDKINFIQRYDLEHFYEKLVDGSNVEAQIEERVADETSDLEDKISDLEDKISDLEYAIDNVADDLSTAKENEEWDAVEHAINDLRALT